MDSQFIDNKIIRQVFDINFALLHNETEGTQKQASFYAVMNNS